MDWDYENLTMIFGVDHGVGAMSMPALVVNEQLVSSGKVLKAAEIIKFIVK